MGIEYSSNLMIGEMFNNNDELDYKELDCSTLEFAGNLITGEYMCIGISLSSIKKYDSYVTIEGVDNYDFIKEKITEKLKKFFPNRELNVKMYLVTTIS